MLALEKIGTVNCSPSARWTSPALAVPIPESEEMRFTVDLRAIIAIIVPVRSSLPHLGLLFLESAGSSVFAHIGDFCHGFWPFPLLLAFQKFTSVMTHIEIFSRQGSCKVKLTQAVTFTPVQVKSLWAA